MEESQLGPFMGEIAEERKAAKQSILQAERGRMMIDNRAVNVMALAMKRKLREKRIEGRTGWETATAEYLSILLRQSLAKGDLVSVANYAAFMNKLGQQYVPE
ncbi:conserved hypothetical protein [Delftia phage PhiW-14]|uniref:Uncharacterized protein n=1 Tax=Delftia phage PhiW-14 TaxID=665032 RepID=C9DG76_BPW14|nr:hypothetical protein DP-phiW-14_gp106 [Delftia phage PhiW-14]ACV50127.1 conserved hypothetical protein [Delftia phage PhiW-14]